MAALFKIFMGLALLHFQKYWLLTVNTSPIPIIVNGYILNKALEILLFRLDVMPDSDGAHVFLSRSKR